jgi:uncharacterized protein
MEKEIQDDLVSVPILVDVPYRFAAGEYMTRFLVELRDNGVFYGTRCPACRRVMIPPRIVCARCHVRSEEWVQLGSEGTLAAFTIMYIPMTDPTTGKPHDPPFAYGSVKLDGCDAPVDHFLNVEPDMDKLWVGMRFRAVLRPKEERTGDLSDIRYFDPLPGQVKPAGAGK